MSKRDEIEYQSEAIAQGIFKGFSKIVLYFFGGLFIVFLACVIFAVLSEPSMEGIFIGILIIIAVIFSFYVTKHWKQIWS